MLEKISLVTRTVGMFCDRLSAYGNYVFGMVVGTFFIVHLLLSVKRFVYGE